MIQLHNQQVQTPLSWYGGKTQMLNQILPELSPHHAFVEVCGGSGAILMAKRPSAVEIYNDIDPGLVNFFRVLKDPVLAVQLESALWLTPYARQEHEECLHNYPSPNPVEWARQFFVLVRQSRSSEFKGSWASSIDFPGKCFHSAISLLSPASARLRNTIIENMDFMELFAKYDGEDVLFYLDPPYLDTTRVAKRAYQHEMSIQQHQQLLKSITQLRGMVILSGYPSQLYDEALTGWRTKTWTVRCSASPTGGLKGHAAQPRRTECLWINPAATKRKTGRIPMEVK